MIANSPAAVPVPGAGYRAIPALRKGQVQEVGTPAEVVAARRARECGITVLSITGPAPNPLAAAYQKLPQFAFFEALTFVLLLLVGYYYILKKGVLEWR